MEIAVAIFSILGLLAPVLIDIWKEARAKAKEPYEVHQRDAALVAAGKSDDLNARLDELSYGVQVGPGDRVGQGGGENASGGALQPPREWMVRSGCEDDGHPQQAQSGK